jgi:hypothetical protein
MMIKLGRPKFAAFGKGNTNPSSAQAKPRRDKNEFTIMVSQSVPAPNPSVNSDPLKDSLKTSPKAITVSPHKSRFKQNDE